MPDPVADGPRRLDPVQRYGVRLTLLAAAVLLVAIPFGALLGQVVTNGPATKWDSDVAEWLKKYHRRNVDLVARTIARGQDQGEIDRSLDPRAAARFLLNALAGLHLLGTISPSGAEVQDVVKMTLKVLDQ